MIHTALGWLRHCFLGKTKLKKPYIYFNKNVIDEENLSSSSFLCSDKTANISLEESETF